MFVVFGVVLSGAVASAQIVKPSAPIGPPQQITAATGRASQSVIHGTAIDTNSSPLPSVSVRLRNLHTNQVEQTTAANQVGEVCRRWLQLLCLREY